MSEQETIAYPAIREVTQTILKNDENEARGVLGNCLQAAVAAALGLDLEAVPHFVQFTWWDTALRLWLRGRGWDVVLRPANARRIPQGRAILVGQSPRHDESHAVVSENCQIAWDPHPDRTGLRDIKCAYVLERWPTANSDRACLICRNVAA